MQLPMGDSINWCTSRVAVEKKRLTLFHGSNTSNFLWCSLGERLHCQTRGPCIDIPVQSGADEYQTRSIPSWRQLSIEYIDFPNWYANATEMCHSFTTYRKDKSKWCWCANMASEKHSLSRKHVKIFDAIVKVRSNCLGLTWNCNSMIMVISRAHYKHVGLMI